MKKIAWCALAVVLAACNDGPVTGPGDAQFAQGGVEGDVNPQIAVAIGGSVSYSSSGTANNGVGTCTTGGAWVNPAGGYTTAGSHPNCAVLVVPAGSISAVGSVAAGKQGNSSILVAPDGWLWYQHGRDRTSATGTFYATDTSGNTWSIAGGQTLLNAQGNFLNRNGMIVIACNSTLGCHPGVLSW